MARITVGRFLSSATDSITAFEGGAPWTTKELTGLVPKEFDYVALGYNVNGNITSAVYRTGGAGGTIVATLAITYVGDLIATVTRT